MLVELLKQDYSRSVYASTVSRMSKGSVMEEHIKLEAESAAREVYMKKAVEINAQKLRLQQLEDQREEGIVKARLKVYKAASEDQDRLIVSWRTITRNGLQPRFSHCKARDR